MSRNSCCMSDFPISYTASLSPNVGLVIALVTKKSHNFMSTLSYSLSLKVNFNNILISEPIWFPSGPSFDVFRPTFCIHFPRRATLRKDVLTQQVSVWNWCSFAERPEIAPCDFVPFLSLTIAHYHEPTVKRGTGVNDMGIFSFSVSLYNFEAPGNGLVILKQRAYMSACETSKNELKRGWPCFWFCGKEHTVGRRERGRSNRWILTEQ